MFKLEGITLLAAMFAFCLLAFMAGSYFMQMPGEEGPIMTAVIATFTSVVGWIVGKEGFDRSAKDK